MIYKWLTLLALSLISLSVTVFAQNNMLITYTNDDVEWQLSAQNDYVGDPSHPVFFLNVSADEDGQIYVANFSSVLIYDGDSGELINSIRDASETIVQYDDAAPAGDGNVWVADSKTFAVYLLNSDGGILQAIPANTDDNPNAELPPNELEVGADGNVYVMYSGANTIMQVFTPDGDFVRSFNIGDRSLSSGLIDFAFGPDGNLYVAGAGTMRVLDPEGIIIVENFAQEFLEANSIAVRGIAVDAEGNVYFGANWTADDGSLMAVVYKADAAGEVVAKFGKAQQRGDWGSEFVAEELGFTVSLAVLPEGQIVISDANSGFSQLLKINMTE